MSETIEFLSYLFMDTDNIRVLNLHGKVIAEYDGRDSIPEELCEIPIFQIHPAGEGLWEITLDTEKE